MEIKIESWDVNPNVKTPPSAIRRELYRDTLDEWSNDHLSTAKLNNEDYKVVYDGILEAMAVVENNPIDGPRLAAWGGYGMCVTYPLAS